MRAKLLPQRVLDGFGTVLGFIGLFARYYEKIWRIEEANPWTKLAELFPASIVREEVDRLLQERNWEPA